MAIFNLVQVVNDMQNHWPSKKCDHQAIAKRYFNLVKRELIRGCFRTNIEQDKFKLIPIKYNELLHRVGRYGPRGKQKYWLDWFQANHPLIEIVKKGSKIGKQGELTVVKLTRELECWIMDADADAIIKSLYENELESSCDFVDIDLVSLDAYIRHNEDTLKYAVNNANHKKALESNNKRARLIRLIAENCNSQLPQVINISQFGRKYYRGVNLQNASKIIRHAALGHCHSYDIEASVFVWKYDTVKDLHPEVKLPNTLTYLDFKDYHRERLADLIFGNHNDRSVKTIKQVITAVGFGARSTNTVWRLENGEWQTSAIKDLIKGNEQLKMLFEDAWFKSFIEEQTLMTNLLFDAVKHESNIKSLKILQNSNGQLNKNRCVSYLYQNAEAQIIKSLEEELHKQNNKILLICHDGFYTKHRADITGLRYLLQKHLPTARLGHEEIKPFRYNPDAVVDEREHKRFMQQEEQRVAELFGRAVHKPRPMYVPRNQVNEEYDSGYDDGSKAYAPPVYRLGDDEELDIEYNEFPEDLLRILK